MGQHAIVSIAETHSMLMKCQKHAGALGNAPIPEPMTMTSVSRDGPAPLVRGTVVAASEATAVQVHSFLTAILPVD